MRSILTLVSCAAITLWLGGLVALFVFVQSLFNADRVVAVQAAPVLFRVFELYQLGLFALAVLALGSWAAIAPNRALRWMIALVLVAGAAAITHVTVVSPRMRALAENGQSGGPDFRRLHGYSMMLFTSEAMILAAAACLLPGAITSGSTMRETFAETVQA